MITYNASALLRSIAFLVALVVNAYSAKLRTFAPESWEYVGPFPTGKPEFDGDPLAAYGGVLGIPRPGKGGSREATFASELAVKGFVGWSRWTAENGHVQFGDPSRGLVDWNGLVGETGSHEVLEHQGWALGDVSLSRAGRYSVACLGLNTVYVSSIVGMSSPSLKNVSGEAHRCRPTAVLVPLAADQYGSGRVHGALDVTSASLKINGGAVTLFAPIRAKVSGRFGCQLTGPHEGPADRKKKKRRTELQDDSAPAALAVARIQVWAPLWMPDLVGSALMGVPPIDKARSSSRGDSATFEQQPYQRKFSSAAPLAVPVFNPSRSTKVLTRARAEIRKTVTNTGEANDARRLAASVLGTVHDTAAISVADGQSAVLPILLMVEHNDTSPGNVNSEASALAACEPIKFDLFLTFKTVDSPNGRSGTAAATEDIAAKGLSVRCRKPSQSFIYSFMDHDGTPSRAAAVAPPGTLAKALAKRRKMKKHHQLIKDEKTKESKENASSTIPILLSLHGTSITPESQVSRSVFFFLTSRNPYGFECMYLRRTPTSAWTTLRPKTIPSGLRIFGWPPRRVMAPITGNIRATFLLWLLPTPSQS